MYKYIIHGVTKVLPLGHGSIWSGLQAPSLLKTNTLHGPDVNTSSNNNRAKTLPLKVTC